MSDFPKFAPLKSFDELFTVGNNKLCDVPPIRQNLFYAGSNQDNNNHVYALRGLYQLNKYNWDIRISDAKNTLYLAERRGDPFTLNEKRDDIIREWGTILSDHDLAQTMADQHIPLNEKYVAPIPVPVQPQLHATPSAVNQLYQTQPLVFLILWKSLQIKLNLLK